MSTSQKEIRPQDLLRDTGSVVTCFLAVFAMIILIPIGWVMSFSGIMSTDSCGAIACDEDSLDYALVLTTFGPGAVLVLSVIVCLLVPRTRPDRAMLCVGSLGLGVFFSLVALVVAGQFLDAVHQS